MSATVYTLAITINHDEDDAFDLIRFIGMIGSAANVKVNGLRLRSATQSEIKRLAVHEDLGALMLMPGLHAEGR